MASSVTTKQVLQPWISGLYATPTIALAPLFILWFGIGIWSKVTVVILLVLFPVTINTEAGLRVTSERLIEMLRSFGASRRQMTCHDEQPVGGIIGEQAVEDDRSGRARVRRLAGQKKHAGWRVAHGSAGIVARKRSASGCGV